VVVFLSLSIPILDCHHMWHCCGIPSDFYCATQTCIPENETSAVTFILMDFSEYPDVQPGSTAPIDVSYDCHALGAAALRTESRMCLLSWFLDPGGWGKAADVGLYFIFPGICTLSLKQQELQKANQKQYAEGKLRGAAPGKKTSCLQQKNVEVKTKKNKQKTPGNGDGISTSETPQPLRKKGARVDPPVENEETFMNRDEVKVDPRGAEAMACGRRDLITRQKQLFIFLPRRTGISFWRIMQIMRNLEEIQTIRNHPDAPMSQVYGAPHLLRLFVQIGAMLAYTRLHEKSLALLLNYLHDFLKYLAKNSAKLFSASDYEVAPAENHRKTM
ncbi:hypothetical protein STEG23_020683, partial [Scotinomys teguina]